MTNLKKSRISNGVKLSFVVPAYNEEEYIVECLHSIFNLRGLSEFEVIVVDNASTDRTAAVIHKSFPQVKVVFEVKRGPARARNSGAKTARGEYLAFIDADCRVPPDWWIKVEEVFQNSSALVMVNGPYRYYEAKSSLARLVYYLTNELTCYIAEFLYRGLLGRGVMAFGGDMVVRRVAYEQIGGFDERFDFYGDDVDIANRLMRVGRVKFTPLMWVFSSARRLQKAGHLRMWFIYSLNGLAVGLFRRVLFREKKYRPYR